MRFGSFILITFFILGCKHPESDEFNKYNDKSKTAVKPPAENYNSITMENEDGVKYIWVEINELKLRFVFDTGASNICISPAEATVLYRQGTLSKEDILNVEYFQDATGRISAGTTINLRNVKVGNMVLENVEALVIDNPDAPLLFGQSALERFGNIEIDNQNGVIILK